MFIVYLYQCAAHCAYWINEWMNSPYPNLEFALTVIPTLSPINHNRKPNFSLILNLSLCWASFFGFQHDTTPIFCWARAPAAHVDRSLMHGASRALSSKPATRRCCCRSTRRTDIRPLHRPCSAYYAGSFNNLTSTANPNPNGGRCPRWQFWGGSKFTGDRCPGERCPVTSLARVHRVEMNVPTDNVFYSVDSTTTTPPCRYKRRKSRQSREPHLITDSHFAVATLDSTVLI